MLSLTFIQKRNNMTWSAGRKLILYQMQFFDSGVGLSERVTDSLRYLFPAGIIVFDTWWQIDDILYRKVKCKMIQKKRNTNKNMIARDVAFVSTDVDRWHDGYSVVMDVGQTWST